MNEETLDILQYIFFGCIGLMLVLLVVFAFLYLPFNLHRVETIERCHEQGKQLAKDGLLYYCVEENQ